MQKVGQRSEMENPGHYRTGILNKNFGYLFNRHGIAYGKEQISLVC